jgi:hypothetical protein
MPELRSDASSHSGQPKGLAFHGVNRGAELAAKADLMLARYPDYMVLAAKPGHVEKGVR